MHAMNDAYQLVFFLHYVSTVLKVTTCMSSCPLNVCAFVCRPTRAENTRMRIISESFIFNFETNVCLSCLSQPAYLSMHWAIFKSNSVQNSFHLRVLYSVINCASITSVPLVPGNLRRCLIQYADS